MSLRLLAPALAVAALLAGLGGAQGLAFYILLAAIVGAAARGLEVVGEVAEDRAGLAGVVLAGVSLLAVLAATAAQTPGIGLVCVAALGVEEFGFVSGRGPAPETEPG